jgi:acetyltransferase
MNATDARHKSDPHAYPRQYETRARFPGHLDISFRPIKPSDAKLLRELFASHSQQTIIHRYFAPLKELSPEQVTHFVDLNYQRDMAIIGLAQFQHRQRMLCVGRFFRNPGGKSAEVAITVHDDCQGRGIGTFLMRILIPIAREHGIEQFTADVLVDNHAMMRLLRKSSHNLTVSMDAGVYHVICPLGK